MQALEWTFILCVNIIKFIENVYKAWYLVIISLPIKFCYRWNWSHSSELLPAISASPSLTHKKSRARPMFLGRHLEKKRIAHYMQPHTTSCTTWRSDVDGLTPPASKFYGPNGTRSTKPDGSYTTSRSARLRHLTTATADSETSEYTSQERQQADKYDLGLVWITYHYWLVSLSLQYKS